MFYWFLHYPKQKIIVLRTFTKPGGYFHPLLYVPGDENSSKFPFCESELLWREMDIMNFHGRVAGSLPLRLNQRNQWKIRSQDLLIPLSWNLKHYSPSIVGPPEENLLVLHTTRCQNRFPRSINSFFFPTVSLKFRFDFCSSPLASLLFSFRLFFLLLLFCCFSCSWLWPWWKEQMLLCLLWDPKQAARPLTTPSRSRVENRHGVKRSGRAPA